MGIVHRLGHDTLENLNSNFQPEATDVYGIPVMRATHTVARHFERFTDYTQTNDRASVVAHFFYDDYRFIQVWRQPYKHIGRLIEYKAVVAPDFSLYTDMPEAVQIIQCYRRQWLGAFWQSLGIDVIPDVIWGEKSSYRFCFAGLPKHSTVALSTLGIKRDKEWNGREKSLFMDGYDEMMRRLEPETILCYGSLLDDMYGNVIRVRTFYDHKRKRLDQMLEARRHGTRAQQRR